MTRTTLSLAALLFLAPLALSPSSAMAQELLKNIGSMPYEGAGSKWY